MDSFKGIDCPSNSHKDKDSADISEPQRERSGQIVSGTVKTPKKNPLGKLADIFLSGSADDVKSQIIFGIVVPTLKRMASDAFDYALNGNRTGKNVYSVGESFTRYAGRFADERRGSTRTDSAPYMVRDIYDIGDIIVNSYGDADILLEELCSKIERFGTATVADLYDCIGKTAVHTDYNYGWNSLRTAKIVRVNGGYALRLPRVIALER